MIFCIWFLSIHVSFNFQLWFVRLLLNVNYEYRYILLQKPPKARRICIGKTILVTQSHLSGSYTNPCKLWNFCTVVKSFPYTFTELNVPVMNKKVIWALNCAMERFNDNVKISKITRICIETTQAWLGDKSCFSHANLSNFWRPLQSLLLR